MTEHDSPLSDPEFEAGIHELLDDAKAKAAFTKELDAKFEAEEAFRDQIVQEKLEELGLDIEGLAHAIDSESPQSALSEVKLLLTRIKYFVAANEDERWPDVIEQNNTYKTEFVVKLYAQYDDEVVRLVTRLADAVNSDLDPVQGVSRDDALIIDVIEGVTAEEEIYEETRTFIKRLIQRVTDEFGMRDVPLIILKPCYDIIEFISRPGETTDPDEYLDLVNVLAQEIQKHYPDVSIFQIQQLVIAVSLGKS